MAEDEEDWRMEMALETDPWAGPSATLPKGAPPVMEEWQRELAAETDPYA
jgi:cell division protein FtsN